MQEGIPAFANYSYTTTQYYINANTSGYLIKIKVYATGYKTAYYSAKLYILPCEFDGLEFNDSTVTYDGKEHSITVSGVPKNSTITYKCLNDASITNTAKNIGEYNIQATVSLANYETKVLTATLKIIESNFAKVDSNKTAFEFDSNTSRAALFAEIAKGNYTIKESFESYRSIYQTGEQYAHYYMSESITGVTNNAYCSTIISFKDTKNKTGIDDMVLKTASIQGDYVIQMTKYLDDSMKFKKAPANSYKETYERNGYEIFAYSEETNESKFSGLTSLGSTTNKYEFRVESNKLIMIIHNYYYHDNDTNVNVPVVNDERITYEFYNIGNTKVEIPNEFIGSLNDVESYEIGEFYLDSIKYTGYYDLVNKKQNFKAYIELSYLDLEICNKNTFTMIPDFDGNPVTWVGMTSYKDFIDYTGYTLNVYCDSNHAYQGEYSKYGNISHNNNYSISTWSEYGGTVHYYGEW